MKAKRNIFVSLFALTLLLCCSMLFEACSCSGKHTHRYGETIVAPTCTESGYTLHKCSCGENYVDNRVAALGHSYGELIAAKLATDTENGYEAHYHCEVCDTYFDSSKVQTVWDKLVIKSSEHTYGNLVTAKLATCLEDGYEAYYYCADCETYFDENKVATTWAELVIGALGHNDDGKVDHEDADCTNDGVVGGTYCTRCNDGKSAAENTIPAKGHNFAQEKAEDGYFKSAATCISPAIYYKSCADCGKSSQGEEGEATFENGNANGHDYGDLITATPVSCTSDGKHAYYHCKECDGYFDENKVATTWDKIEIKSNGHDYGTLVHNPATCTQSGYDDYYHCSVCKTYFDAEKVPTTLYDLEQDAIEHVNNEYFEAKAATCLEEGNAEYLYCPDCKNYLDIDFNVLSWSDDILIAKTDHAYGTLVHNPATCTTDGYNDYYKCSVCKAYFDSTKKATTLTALAVSATGHHYTDTVVDATCSTTGYTNHVCACGDNYKDTATAKIDHDCNDLDVCSMCNNKIFELNFTLSTDESYYIVSGIKHGKTATTFSIPAEYDGKPVKEIGASAFEGNTKLTNVTVPESVTTIGANAFKGCTSLATVPLHDKLTSIGASAFEGCGKLTTISLSGSLTSIDSRAFAKSGLTGELSIDLLSKVLVGESAFSECTKLTKVYINKCQSVGTTAFYGCTALKRS